MKLTKTKPAKTNGKQDKKKVQVKVKLNLWKIIIISLLFIFFFPFIIAMFQFEGFGEEVQISQALTDIREGEVKEILIRENKLELTYNDDAIKTSTKEEGEAFAELLEKEGIEPSSVNYTVEDLSIMKIVGEIFAILLPLGLFALLFFFILRSQNKGAQDVFSFGKSGAKLFAKGKQDVTFNDVAGVEDAKKELEEVVDFLKNPA